MRLFHGVIEQGVWNNKAFPPKSQSIVHGQLIPVTVVGVQHSGKAFLDRWPSSLKYFFEQLKDFVFASMSQDFIMLFF